MNDPSNNGAPGPQLASRKSLAMRYAMIDQGQGPQPALLQGDSARLFAARIPDLRALMLLAPEQRLQHLTDTCVPRQHYRLTVPLRPPKNIVCVGRNYLAHAEESAQAVGQTFELPDVPTFFTKAPTAIAGPDDLLRLSAAVSKKYDWEAELAIVIGRAGRDIPEEQALSSIFGYTCLNDITARDLQKSYGQWFKGKSLDSTCPLGPWIIDAAEIPDPQNLAISLRINGVTKQAGSTKQMIFPVARIIAELSRGMTLEVGDIIATGTPEGVGFARTPPEYLQHDDQVEVEIEKIGILQNLISIT